MKRLIVLGAVAALFGTSAYARDFNEAPMQAERVATGELVLEPVAAPKNFPVRFAWSARYATDPANNWLRETVIVAYRDHEADITAHMSAAAIPLGA